MFHLYFKNPQQVTLRPQDTVVVVGVQKRQVTDFEPVSADASCVIFLSKVPKWSICTLTKYFWRKIRGGSLCAHRIQLLRWASRKGKSPVFKQSVLMQAEGYFSEKFPNDPSVV